MTRRLIVGFLLLVLVGGSLWVYQTYRRKGRAAPRPVPADWVVQRNMEFGFIDRTGRVVVPLRFAAALPFREGLAPVHDGQVWGYIDTTGRFLIPPQFVNASIFQGGFARVVRRSPSTASGDTTFFIDHAGQPATVEAWDLNWEYPFEVHYLSLYSRDLSAYAALRPRPDSLTAAKIKAWNDAHRPRSGESDHRVVPLRKSPWWAKWWKPRAETANSMRIPPIRSHDPEDRYGYVNRHGQWVIPPRYGKAWPFQMPGVAWVTEDTSRAEEGHWILIDTLGREIVPQRFRRPHAFVDGVAWVATQDSTGLIDPAGRWLYVRPYERAEWLGEGVLKVWQDQEQWQLVDTSGVVIPFTECGWILKFSQGRAAVWCTEQGTRGTRGFIDRQGRWVTKPVLKSAGDFHEGLAWAAESDLRKGFVDSAGVWVIPPVYADVSDFRDGLAVVAWSRRGQSN